MAHTLPDAKYPNDVWGQWGWEFRRFDQTMSKDCSTALLAAANTALPFSKSKGIIDIGCGRGGNISALLSTFDTVLPTNVPITAIDSSPGMIDQIKQRLQGDYPSWTHIKTEVQDITNLSEIKDDSFTHVLSGFTLYFLPPAALQEAYRVTAPGGILATNSMASNTWWEMMSTISLIKPEFKLPGLPAGWTTVASMTETLKNAGLKDVEVTEMEIGLPYEDADEMAKFLIRVMPYIGPMTSGFTAEERVRWEGLVADWVRRECKGGKMGGVALVGVGRK
ncbi:hypothetical protein V495_04383 [Pseudogymnoascus sp. VKM F-4514 (FW-929)]|nr:hypothetical protein V495_04383 [Pseudogymnoascus sp. VKM F-4514 (FW-929)]KFY54004.1 hypothetical protein V497_08041 [Pseudogymnoascus sp. VKM F-4516 (FW-969)]